MSLSMIRSSLFLALLVGKPNFSLTRSFIFVHSLRLFLSTSRASGCRLGSRNAKKRSVSWHFFSYIVGFCAKKLGRCGRSKALTPHFAPYRSETDWIKICTLSAAILNLAQRDQGCDDAPRFILAECHVVAKHFNGLFCCSLRIVHTSVP